jgi:hypothetical protein
MFFPRSFFSHTFAIEFLLLVPLAAQKFLAFLKRWDEDNIEMSPPTGNEILSKMDAVQNTIIHRYIPLILTASVCLNVVVYVRNRDHFPH